MRRKGSFSGLFPSASVPPAQEPKRLPGCAYPEPQRLSLSLSLPLSSTQSSPREYDERGTSRTSSTSDAAAVALDRAVAEVLCPSSHGSDRIAMAPAIVTDGEVMQGYMVIHSKKPKRKKLFTLNRSYFVVADASRPVLEVFANETRAERVYLFSLAGAYLDFETDDVSHAVRAKCFCLNVQSWRKRGVDYLRPQGFVFYQENQALMMVWVKCIHVAIRRANAATKLPAGDMLLFRRSDASTVGVDDSSATESERVADADTEEHDEPDRESLGRDVVVSVAVGCPTVLEEERPAMASPPVVVPREETITPTPTTVPSQQTVVVALPAAPRSPRRTRGQSRRRAGFDPAAGTSTPPAIAPVPSPGTRPKPPHFGRLNTMLATMKNASHLHNPGTEEDKAESTQPPSSTPTSTKPRPSTSSSSFSPPSIMSSLHMPRGKSSSTRHVTSTASPTTTSSASNKRLSDPFQFRKKDDTLFGGFSPFFSPKGPRSNPKQNAKNAARNGGDVAPLRTSSVVPGKVNTAATRTPSDSDQLGSTSSGSADDRSRLEWQLSSHLARLVFLLVAFAGGVLQLSLFLPFAAAGVFVYAHEPHADVFASASVAALWVHVASSVQGSLGLCSVAAIAYGWSYADFREAQWRRRRHLAERLLQEESDSFAHIQFPNWIVRPDVDRVDWLNKVLVNGWPFMKIAIRNSILDNVNPLLDGSRPAFLSSLSLVRVDLGNRAPVITGVKFVSANTQTEEVTLDVDVRVMGDESLTAELRLVSALGAAAVVSLRDLLLAGTLRVTLSPLATYWPCFGAISLCFVERPLVDFSLTAAKINLSNVPFASEWLQTFLHDLLLDYFVWPKVTHIPLWDETGAPAVAATSTPVTNP